MMFKDSYELEKLEEQEKAKKYREMAMNSDIVNDFVSVLSDYSVYNLFEEVRMTTSEAGISYYADRWKKAINDDTVGRERSYYRKKVFNLLKTSKYDDGYVEDNIENYTDILIAFCTSPRRLFAFTSLYNNKKDEVEHFYDVVKNPPLEEKTKEWIKKRTKVWNEMKRRISK